MSEQKIVNLGNPGNEVSMESFADLMDFVTNAPRGAYEFCDYAIQMQRDHLEYWSGGKPPPHGPDRTVPLTVGHVMEKIDRSIYLLSEVKRRMDREQVSDVPRETMKR